MLHALMQKKVFIIVLVLIFLFVTWLIFYTSQDEMNQTWLEFVVKIILYPFQKIIDYISDFFSNTWKTMTGLSVLNRENHQLRLEVLELQMELTQLRQLRAENERLREALEFEKTSAFSLEPAVVIARNPSHWTDTVIINKGSKSGLAKNMPVITKDGVVGRLLNVEPYSSEVILLSDPRDGNSMSGVIGRTRGLVYIYGGGRKGYCLVRPSDLDVKFKIGDKILTSESSLYFPKDLVIGEIQEIIDHGDGFEQEAVMKPVVKFSHLEILYVIKNTRNVQSSVRNELEKER